MAIADIDLNDLAVFTEVVRHGSFSAAGRSLGLPPSAVSRRVARLEERLGYVLLHRTTRSVGLTPAGRISLRSALDAYTINGAKLYGHEDVTGSLEVGKYADLVLIDRDLFDLVESGRADDIGASKVLLTLFRGRPVYRGS